MFYIGIDVGATKLAAGLWSAEEQFIKIIESDSNYITGEALVQQICDAISSLMNFTPDKSNITMIGIGIPGRIDDATQTVFSDSLGFPEGIPLKKRLTENIPCEVIIENDANAAALGEFYYGAGLHSKNILYVSVGTGIGAGLILDGRLYTGACHLAGELGHIVINPQSEICTCGRKGCVEIIASGKAIGKKAVCLNKHIPNKKNATQDTQEVFHAYHEGDQTASIIIEDAAWSLASAIHDAVNLLDPDIVIIGGGVVKEQPKFIELIRKHLPHINIHPAQLGAKLSGLYGSVALCNLHSTKKE